MYLHAEPIVTFIMVNVHGNVVHLGHPHKPMTFEKPRYYTSKRKYNIFFVM